MVLQLLFMKLPLCAGRLGYMQNQTRCINCTVLDNYTILLLKLLIPIVFSHSCNAVSFHNVLLI